MNSTNKKMLKALFIGAVFGVGTIISGYLQMQVLFLNMGLYVGAIATIAPLVFDVITNNELKLS